MVEKPHRRFEVTITVSADSWEDASRVIEDLLPHIVDHGPRCNSVSGGYSAGASVDIREDPEMTHERWWEAMEAYLAAARAGEGQG